MVAIKNGCNLIASLCIDGFSSLQLGLAVLSVRKSINQKEPVTGGLPTIDGGTAQLFIEVAFVTSRNVLFVLFHSVQPGNFPVLCVRIAA